FMATRLAGAAEAYRPADGRVSCPERHCALSGGVYPHQSENLLGHEQRAGGEHRISDCRRGVDSLDAAACGVSASECDRGGCAGGFALTLQRLQIRLGTLQLWKQPLLGLKLPPVHAAASVLCLHRMLEVEHLVVHQVFNGIARRISAVEDATNHDGI